MTRLDLQVIQTERLVLVPLDDETAGHLLGGDASCLDHVAGWPHEETLDGVRLHPSGAAIWLVGLDGVVIGDCGTAGPIENGSVEIGFGLAEEERGKGYGTELVGALSDWLLAYHGVERIVARTDVANKASRTVLERAGFGAESESDGVVLYAR